MLKKIVFSKVFILSQLLLIFNVITLSIGDEESTVTVVNKTSYYLHIIIDGTPFLYVQPDKSITKSSEPVSTMLVNAFYSPGQGIKGSVTLSTDIPYRGALHGCNCTEGYPECSYTPPVGGSAKLEITPNMLSNDTTGNGTVAISEIWINDLLKAEAIPLVSRNNYSEFCLLGNNFSGIGTSTFYVDDVILTTIGSVLYRDDFESYSVGTHPSADWVTQFSGAIAQISDNVAHSGSKSFQLSSNPNWARVEAIRLFSIPDNFSYDVWIYLAQSDRGAQVGFGKKESSNTYRAYNSVIFGNDNSIYFAGSGSSINLGSWSPGIWYHVKVICNFNYSQQTEKDNSYELPS